MAEPKKKYDVNAILEKSYAELTRTNIDEIVSDFKPIFIEFYNYIESRSYIIDENKEPAVEYIKMLYEFMNFLKKTFAIDIENLLVFSHHYTTSDWGPLYWNFLHYSSILIQYLNNQTPNVNLYNFPIIVYHIENILPCNKCIGHFLEFKKTELYKLNVKTASYGLTIYSTFVLHDIITFNIYKNQYNLNETNIPKFLPIDFMKKYKCYPNIQTQELYYKNFVIEPVDFQNPIHINISYLLSAYFNVSYLLVSRIIKRLYNKNVYQKIHTYRYLDVDDEVLLKKSDEDIKNILESLINKNVVLNNENSSNMNDEYRKNVMEESINYILSKCA